jgi:signal transduction histidine kinase
MIPSDLGAQNKELSLLSKSFAALRDKVISTWIVRVKEVIPAAAQLSRPILTNTLPILYDNIAQSMTPGYPRDTANSANNIGAAHGRDRAAATDYTISEIVHELQIFRDIIFLVSETSGLNLKKSDASIIHDSLDWEIRESITAFSKAYEEQSQMFIARIAHDLRNPLHVASGAAQLIKLKSNEENSARLANLAVDKLTEVDTMIQTILDTAVGRRHKKLELKLESFDMKLLAKEVCLDSEFLGQKCNVVGEDVCGFWSRAAMKGLLENLLSNARKYGRPETEVMVSVKEAEGRVILAVHNEGEPISAEVLPRLFTAFERGVEHADVKGWGLGLPYVQQVAESHHGTVIVDSAAGRGTTFTVSIPIDCRPFATEGPVQ